jgi:hypothetical protein
VTEEQGQAPNETPQAGNPDDGEQQQAGAGDVQAELRRARDDAAKYRTQLRDNQEKLKALEAAQKERDDAEKTELQKAIDKANDLEARLLQADNRTKSLALENAVVLKAQALGIVDPDAAYRLLDKDAVEFDGDKPKNIDELLNSLIESRPYLKGKKTPGGQQNGSTAAPDSGNRSSGPQTMDDVAKMTESEINAHWDQVQKVMAQGR